MTDQLNTKRGVTIQVDCLCSGRNRHCVMCAGSAVVSKRSCTLCGGVGKHGGARCPDCKGHGWRDLDNMMF